MAPLFQQPLLTFSNPSLNRVITLTEIYNFQTTDTFNAMHSSRQMGERLDSGHTGIGLFIQNVQMRLGKVGTPTGNYRFEHQNSSDTILATSGNGDAAALGSQAFVELSFPSPVQMSLSDKIILTFDGGDASNYVEVSTNNNNVAPANTSGATDNGGGYSYSTIDAFLMIFDSNP